jgi:hypothetical protein
LVSVDLPHSGVVAGVGSDDEFVGMFRFQMAHDVRQLAGSEFATSTGAVAELR